MLAEINHLLFLAIVAVTFCATAAYLVFFVGRKEAMRRVARLLLLATGILQSLYLVCRALLLGHAPITSLHEALLLFAWSLTWAHHTFRWRYRAHNVGALTSVLVLVLTLAAASASRTPVPLDPVLRSWWLPVHAGLALVAYGFLALAFVGGLMYLVQEWELKSKRFGFFFSRLPSLEALDQLNSHCLMVGFLLLSLGMVTGIAWNRQAFGSYWRWDPKEVWTLVTWGLYLVQFHQRYALGWRGRRAAVMAVIGFCAVLFTLWGVTCLLGGEHSYV